VETRSTTIEVSTPFSLKAVALSHGWHECSPMNWSEGGKCLQVIRRNGADPYRVSIVEGERRRDRVTLRVAVDAKRVDTAVVRRVRRDVPVMLELDADLTEFYEICRRHHTLHVLERIGAGRFVRSVSMFENVVKALCATNVNWTQAVKMINRIGQLGPIVPHFRNLTAWPTPREILRAGEAYLNGVCRLGYRTESVLEFCRDVCAGGVDPESLNELAADPTVETEELLKRLRAIRGIGPSSAHYLLSFLGRHESLSIDSATFAHVAATRTNGKRPTLKQIERIYAPYGRWKNKVCWFENWIRWGTARGLLRAAKLMD